MCCLNKTINCFVFFFKKCWQKLTQIPSKARQFVCCTRFKKAQLNSIRNSPLISYQRLKIPRNLDVSILTNNDRKICPTERASIILSIFSRLGFHYNFRFPVEFHPRARIMRFANGTQTLEQFRYPILVYDSISKFCQRPCLKFQIYSLLQRFYRFLHPRSYADNARRRSHEPYNRNDRHK